MRIHVPAGAQTCWQLASLHEDEPFEPPTANVERRRLTFDPLHFGHSCAASAALERTRRSNFSEQSEQRYS